jgi:glutathione S-transferase
MELYHFGFSTCSQKVRLVLAEKGLEPVDTWAPAPVIELMRRGGESEWAGIERIARERSDS